MWLLLPHAMRFAVCVSLLDRLLASLRRCCRAIPDTRRGRNATYAMADFVLCRKFCRPTRVA